MSSRTIIEIRRLDRAAAAKFEGSSGSIPDDSHQYRHARITLAWGLSPKTELFFLSALREGTRAAPYPVPRTLMADLSLTWGEFATSSPHLQRSASSPQHRRSARNCCAKHVRPLWGAALRSAGRTDPALRAVSDISKFLRVQNVAVAALVSLGSIRPSLRVAPRSAVGR